MITVDIAKQTVTYLNSMIGEGVDKIHQVVSYVEHELKAKRNLNSDSTEWRHLKTEVSISLQFFNVFKCIYIENSKFNHINLKYPNKKMHETILLLNYNHFSVSPTGEQHRLRNIHLPVCRNNFPEKSYLF
jgi:hypothetical protein